MPGPEDNNREVTLILFGICTWDYLTSLWFEHRLITRKIRFRWHFVPYFVARYSVLALIIACLVDAIGGDSPMSPHCSRAALENVILHLGILTLAFGTWNLLTRTLIIWGHHPVLVRILFVVGLLHFALAILVASLGRTPCTSGPPSVLCVVLFGCTTAVIEFATLSLSLIGIRRSSLHGPGDSYLARLLRAQGIVYFVVVFFIQVSAIAVSLAHTDGATRMWVGISGSTLSPILSCRLVTSTLSDGSPVDRNLGPRTLRPERFELSEFQGRNPSVDQMTTCIDIDTTKDGSVC